MIPPISLRRLALTSLLIAVTTIRITAQETTPPLSSPASSTAPNGTKTAAAVSSDSQIEITTDVIEIPEEGWERIHPLNPHPTPSPAPSSFPNIVYHSPFNFNDYASEFPDLKNEKQSYAELVQELTSGKIPAQNPDQLSGWVVLGNFPSATKEAMLRAFHQMKASSISNILSVTMNSGQEGTVSVTRPFPYPAGLLKAFNPKGVSLKDVGFTMRVRAQVERDKQRVVLQITCESTVLLGFLSQDGKKFSPDDKMVAAGIASPVFSTKKSDADKLGAYYMDDQTNKLQPGVDLGNDQTVLLGMVQLQVQPGKDGGAPDTVRKVILVFVTAHIIGSKTEEEVDVNPIAPPPNTLPPLPTVK